MCAKERVLAAWAWRDAKRRFAPSHAFWQGARSHDEMINLCIHQSITFPSTQVTLAPPIQMSPPSCCTCTRPARASAVPDGEDWSSEHSEAALVAHVRERVDHYLSEAVVSTVVDEFTRLERELSA